MKVDWSPLLAELALWRRDRLALPLWWRDDDAVAATPALERLEKLSAQVGLPVHLAVIPALVEPSLQAAAQFIPVVHGWHHISHAPDGAKKAEFGHNRAAAQDEVRAGLARLSGHFGPDLLPLFVPPWNRITPDLLPALCDAGFHGVSVYGPRKPALSIPGIVQINTHIDPIFWRGDRGLVPPADLLEHLVATLRDRRAGHADVTQPLGLLTHHLVHTQDVWAFSGDVLRVLLDGGAVPADLRALLYAGRRPSI